MAMEAETISMLIFGFIVVTAICLAIIIKLWFKRKGRAHLWFVLQFVFLYLSFFEFIYAIKGKPNIPAAMLSEENSWVLGISGILWAASMLCMIRGFWLLEKRN